MELENVTSIEEGRKKDPAATESITQERYDEVAAALRAHKDSTGETWEDIAKAMGGQHKGVSLSIFASGKYKAKNAGRILPRVEEFLTLVEERRGLVTHPEFVFTSISKRIFSLIKQCLLLTKMGVIGAESGTGKTRSIEEWHITHPNTTLVRANRTYCPSANAGGSSPIPLLQKLSKAIGCGAPSNKGAVYTYDTIVDTLRGSNRLVIIDEAHFLPPEALDVVRTIHEEANVPIVLAGHAQLCSRAPRDYESAIAYRSRALMEKITTAQVRPGDVDLIAAQIVGVEVARDGAQILLGEARSNGGLRRLVTLLQVAQTYRNADEAVKRSHVVRAIEEHPHDGGAL